MALEGTFEDMSLTDLFHVFTLGSKTGTLVLRQTNVGGLVYVAAGQLRDALIIGEPGRSIVARGEAAVVHMLCWSQARFTFRHDVAVAQRPPGIIHDWQWLVRAAEQRGAEYRAPRTKTARLPLPPTRPVAIAPDAPLVLRRAPAGSQIKLNVDEWRLLSWIAQSYSARQIARTTGCDLGQLLVSLTHLHEMGLVTVSAADPHPRSGSGPCHTSANVTVLPERRVLEVVMRRLREA